MRCSIDLPRESEVNERLSVRARGWIVPADLNGPSGFSRLRIVHGGSTVAQTERLLWRADVVAALALPAGTATGFDLIVALPEAPLGGTAELEFWIDGSNNVSRCFGRRTIRLATREYGTGLFSEFLNPRVTEPRGRADIFRAGPPSSEPSRECLDLIVERFSPVRHPRILDVGCGSGAYARPLMREGFAWTGIEVNPALCARLAGEGLPFVRGDGVSLPFERDSFEAAICIEVLEHTEEPDRVVREIRRVAREAVFSVPNCELVPYLAVRLATPWHMIEPDHRNFFSRWSLESLLRRHFRSVEVTAYGPAPVRSEDGAELCYHLLAHAR